MDVVVGFSDKASKGLKNVGGQFSRTSKSITGKVSGLISKFGLFAGVGGIAGVTLAISKAVSTFSSFEKAVANAASVTGATGKAFEDTKKHIAAVSKELGESTVFSASQAASAFYDLASAGYDVASMTKGDLQPIMDLAAATQTDLTKTTEVTTSTLGQFGLGIESSGRIADVFAKTIGSSKATVDKLQNSLKYVGPVANSMGMDIESVNAILGNLYNAGFKGEQAGTALRGAFSSLLNPTGQAADALDAMGLSIEDVNPTTHDFADILDTLTAAGMDTNSAMKLFGVEAAPAMLALTENTDGIRDLNSALKDAGGTAKTMAKEQLATFSGSITLLKSALEGVAITIGGAVAPYLKTLAEWLTKAIPPTMKLAGRVKKTLMPIFNKVSDWIKKTAIPLFKKIADKIKKMVMPRIEKLQKIVMKLTKAFSGTTKGVGDANDVFKLIDPVIKLVGASLDVLLAIINYVTDGVIALKNYWDSNFLGIKTITLTIVDIIVNAFILVINALTTVINTITWLINKFDDLMAWLSSNAVSMWNGLTSAMTTVTDALTDIYNWFVDLMGIDFKWFDIPNPFKNIDFCAYIPGWLQKWLGICDETQTTPVLTDIADPFTDTFDTVNNMVTGAEGLGTDIANNFNTGIGSVTLSGLFPPIMPSTGDDSANAAGCDVAEQFNIGLNSITLSELNPPVADGMQLGVDVATAFSAGLSSVTQPNLSPGTGGGGGNGGGGGSGGTGHWVQNNDLSMAEKNSLAAQYMAGTITQEDYFNATHTWVESTGGTPGGETSPGEVPPIPPGTITRVGPYNNHHGGLGWDADWINNEGTWGYLGEVIGSLNDLIGGMYVLQSVFDTEMNEQQQQNFMDSHGGIIDDTTHELTQQYAKGGYVPYDMNADIHEGEYVIPARGAPVLSGGKDINLNITYNMGDIIGIDDLQSILGQHDQKLLQKLQSLI